MVIALLDNRQYRDPTTAFQTGEMDFYAGKTKYFPENIPPFARET